jgi:hypothetical protein
MALESADPRHCREHALGFSWDRCVEMFVSYLAPIKRNRMGQAA